MQKMKYNINLIESFSCNGVLKTETILLDDKFPTPEDNTASNKYFIIMLKTKSKRTTNFSLNSAKN